MLNTLLLIAPQDAPGGAASPLFTFLPLILVFVVFWLFIIRPQRKRDAERKGMIAAVKKGDKILTIGGVHATVQQVDETSVLAQIDTNTKIRLEKSAIASIQP